MNKSMHFDFNSIIDRKNTNSYKWAVADDELPMWVADMDFPTAPPIMEAILKRAKFGVFGYENIPNEWYQTIENWWKKRHNFEIKKEWLLFCTGVVPAISSIVRKLTTIGEKILLQPPVYHIFYNSIVNNGRLVECCNLLYKQDSGYQIDFADLEQKLSDPQVTLMLLCNPHNPVGKIWDKETLRQIGELCQKHHVLVLSDEIHCDLTEPDHAYTPFASVSECCAKNSITCIAPTKTFNLAGLQTAAVVVPDEALRHKVWRALNTDEIAEPNSFAIIAAIAAFSLGEPWLEALREYLTENKRTAREFIAKELPQITVTPSTATYLLWLDCSLVSINAHHLSKFIRKETGLWLSDGTLFGGNGDGFLRMNIACPKSQLEDGLNRLKKAIHLYKSYSANFC